MVAGYIVKIAKQQAANAERGLIVIPADRSRHPEQAGG
jgi:hypothetical protein